MKKLISALIFAIAVTTIIGSLAIPTLCHAFELSPMEMEYGTGSGQSSQTFFVENKGSSPVAAQIRVYRRSTDSAGEEVRSETSDFLVFPTQVLLGANERRAVRVVYKGTSNLTQEAAYRLVAEQLPLSTDPVVASGSTSSKVQIKYLLKFVASIYVEPKNASSKVVVQSMSTQGDKLQLTLANSGSKHKTLKGARIFIRGQNKSFEIDSAELKLLDQINLLSGSSATFSITKPTGFPADSVETDVKFD